MTTKLSKQNVILACKNTIASITNDREKRRQAHIDSENSKWYRKFFPYSVENDDSVKLDLIRALYAQQEMHCKELLELMEASTDNEVIITHEDFSNISAHYYP